MTDLHDLAANEVLKLYAGRDLSPSEYFEHLVKVVSASEPKLNALYDFDPDPVMREAELATKRWAKKAPLGTLDGLPVTIKDNIDTKGWVTPMGSAGYPPKKAEVNAPCAARVLEAGAIVLSKTTMPDFGMLSSGMSTKHGVTRNPWNLKYNPGGSSSGAGAAAAAGYGPLHIGTDIGGSVRLPAAWCGLVGFKPTLGRIPVYPYFVGRCAGPMTRTVDDTALLMSQLSKPDLRDATSIKYEDIDWTPRIIDLKGIRVGLQLDPGAGLKPNVDIVEAVKTAARWFEEQGALVEPIDPIINEEILQGIETFFQARQLSESMKLPSEYQQKIMPFVKTWAAQAEGISSLDTIRAFGQVFENKKRTAEVFLKYDLVISPTNQIGGYSAEWPCPTNQVSTVFHHIAFTLPWNTGEQPALSINCGFDSEGMPIGLQLVAPKFKDKWLIDVAKTYESWRGAIQSWPSV